MDAQVPLAGHAARPGGYFHMVSLGLLVFLPASLFMASLCFMTFLFKEIPSLVWVIISMCLGLSLLLMVVRQKYWFNLGVVCFVAVVVGTGAGLWNYQKNMDKYWAYQGQRTYTDVPPTKPALQHLDAGKIVFTADSVIDEKRTSTLVSGRTYCVAPIVKRGAAGTQSLQYWAAGEDCCVRGSNFTCDDAADPAAHAGLVYLDDFALPDYDMGKFRAAAKAIIDARGLSGAKPEDAIFVRWVKDADAAHREYWFVATNFAIMGICVYTVFAVLAGFGIHFTSRRAPPKSKMEARYGGRP